MSKGNMLLGYARGKVGSLVFSRQDNEQIVRARNYHPRNPRTNAQLYQRAIMATVMQAYSVGKEIFDHSFQGKSVGNMNMREFLSRNARILRQQIAASVDNNFTDNGARVIAPKSLYMAPFEGMVVSAGNYPQQWLTYINGTYDNLVEPGGTFGEYVARTGLVPGDIYTFIVINGQTDQVVFTATDGADDAGKQIATSFGFIRLQVKADLPADDEQLANVNTNAVFEVTDIINATPPALTGKIDTFQISANSLGANTNEQEKVIATALIRSRFDEDLRSDSQLHLVTKEFGISPEYLLDAWKKGTNELGNSDLILEGGNF